MLAKSPVRDKNQHLLAVVDTPKKKGNKYRNTKAVDEFGNEYDSKKEMKRGRELKLLLKAGEIGFLARHVEFQFTINGAKIASYYADFVYTETATGKMVVEDVKSEATRKLSVYRLKKRMMLQQHAITIKEV
jgi:hypothetical protein